MNILDHVCHKLQLHINGVQTVSPTELLAEITEWKQKLVEQALIAQNMIQPPKPSTDIFELHKWLLEPGRRDTWMTFTSSDAARGFPSDLRGKANKDTREQMLEMLVVSGKLKIIGPRHYGVLPA